MPAILPPPAFDVPAIIRVAAHAPANQAAIHLSVPTARGTATLANPSPQPLSSMQGPQIVTPPHVPQPLSSMQGPQIVTPPQVPQLSPTTTGTSGQKT